ncbi:MAG TPA: glucosidase [Candidatus Dormibacteraeota bacterium]|nr:glucosidase [Candidatus Dormibacteraeota bacterium]
MPSAEAARLQEVLKGRSPWRRWGPYLSERAWGTVREDYSEHGEAWDFFPHDHARSRTYRWNEDGLAGICDDRQQLCLALALWNGRDPILKERIFGLTSEQGNHGEDAKEYWFYLDSTPTHSWMRWRYMYPQAAFPYADLVEENGRRRRDQAEYELLETGIFDSDRYWEVTAEFAKADQEDILIRLSVRNAGPDTAELDLIPMLWFRNTWSWGLDDRKPQIAASGSRLVAEHFDLGRRILVSDGTPEPLFCDNETNTELLWGIPGRSFYPKDAINDYVVHGAAAVNPARRGTKAGLRHHLTVASGKVAVVRIRLSPDGKSGADFDETMALREREANEFYAELTPAGASPEEAMVLREALGGMLWSKQFYHYDVGRWLEGDPAGPKPPDARRTGRNSDWAHLDNRDVISMPDKWEYPWYAAWDLAFHCVALAWVDPELAKSQLVLLGREWFMHPNGQLPAYEWAFGDVNLPVHAWAALRVFEISGGTDHEFLERIFHKLLLNFTWWVNRKDSEGNNVFQGGFLGLDNIGPFDRSHLPVGGHIEQSDGTAWMAMYCQNLLEMALVLAEHDPAYEDMAIKFFEHFALIASALNARGLWNEQDGFYYDVLHFDDGRMEPLRAHSLVGLVPLFAVSTMGPATLTRLPEFTRRTEWFLHNRPGLSDVVQHIHSPNHPGWRMLSIVSPDRLRRILERMLDPAEFLSDYGIRALSRYHLEHPLQVDLGGGVSATLNYEPAESTTPLFGGNSNWRGPIWMPVNFLIVEVLRVYHRYLGADFKVEFPTGSGRMRDLAAVADEISGRLVRIFLGHDGRRPVFGRNTKFQDDHEWHDMLAFHEYFDGDTGAGLGASHQTGWTGLVADLIIRAHGSTLR